MSIISTTISTLEGRVGSNPELIKVFPPSVLDIQDQMEKEKTYNELLNKSLPNGANPYEFFEDKFLTNRILVYTFEIFQEDGRNDLASIGFSIDKDMVVDDLKIIITDIIQFMRDSKILSMELVKENLQNIMKSLNKRSKLKIKANGKKFVLDIASILKEKNITLENPRFAKGML